MTVKEAVILAAEELGVGDKVKNYYENGGEEGKRETETLVRCFNIVENEIALDYLPLCCEDEAESDTGTIEYSLLTMPCVRIIPRYGRIRKFRPVQAVPSISENTAGARKRLLHLYPSGKKRGRRIRFRPVRLSQIVRLRHRVGIFPRGGAV